MVLDQAFHIPHDLAIAPVDKLSHGLQRLDPVAVVVRGRGLRRQDKGNSQESLKRARPSENDREQHTKLDTL